MNELMSREDAIKILKPFRDCMVDQNGCPISDVVFALDKAIEVLKQEERKQGRWSAKWIPKPELGWGETYICSECGEKTTSTIMGKPRYRYCPMCGSFNGEDDDAKT